MRVLGALEAGGAVDERVEAGDRRVERARRSRRAGTSACRRCATDRATGLAADQDRAALAGVLRRAARAGCPVGRGSRRPGRPGWYVTLTSRAIRAGSPSDRAARRRMGADHRDPQPHHLGAAASSAVGGDRARAAGRGRRSAAAAR